MVEIFCVIECAEFPKFANFCLVVKFVCFIKSNLLVCDFELNSDYKLRAHSQLTLDCHSAAHLLHEVLTDTEAQPSALLVHICMLIES